jgi:hypothetical protein
VDVVRTCRAAVDASQLRLQLAEVEVKARSEQDQRPKRRRDQRRDDLGDSGQVRVVVVLGGDEYPEHDLRDRGQTAHSLIFGADAGGPSPQRCEVCRAVVRMAATGRGGTDRIARLWW